MRFIEAAYDAVFSFHRRAAVRRRMRQLAAEARERKRLEWLRGYSYRHHAA